MLELIWPEINTVGHARNSVFNVRYNESSDIEGRRISNKSTEKSHELEARKDSAELKIRESIPSVCSTIDTTLATSLLSSTI